MMNEHPEYASQWKGRVLIQVEVEETDKPLAKTQDITDDLIAKAKKFAVPHEYAAIC